MDSAALIARLILAGVFSVSGTAKLADRNGTRRAVDAFGLPKRLVDPVARGLPIAECFIAASLIPGTTAWFGGFAAIGLLAAFIVGISANLVRGNRPDCNCFGNLHSAPVGPATLARNAIFVGLGITVVADGRRAGGAMVDAYFKMTAAGRVSALILLTSAVIGLVLLRLRAAHLVVGSIPTSADVELGAGLDRGTRAPAFSLPTLSGEHISVDDLRARGKPVLLVFVSMSCGPCTQLAPELARWQREFPGRITIAVITSGEREFVQLKADTYGFAELLIDENGDASHAYRNSVTPGAVLIDPEGLIASEPAFGVYQIGDLLLHSFGLSDVVASLLSRDDADARDENGHDHADGHAHDRDEPWGHGPSVPDPVDPEEIDASFSPVARTDTAMEERDQESVVVDLANGLVHLLNPTAAIVWRCLDGSGTVAEIAADIAEVFGQDPEQVLGPVLEVVKGFGRQGLLAGVGAPSESLPVSG